MLEKALYCFKKIYMKGPMFFNGFQGCGNKCWGCMWIRWGGIGLRGGWM
jgi:hypothetical protein